MSNEKVNRDLREEEMKMKLDLESNAGTSFSEGYMHLENGRYAEAARIFRSIVKSDPLDAASYYHLGNALRGLGKQGQALESYIAAMKLDENEGAYYYRAACCCFSLGFQFAKRTIAFIFQYFGYNAS